MANALIFSDLHLHAHKDRVERLHDCIEVLDWIFRTAEERNCKYIFFLGDLFHERSKIDVLNYLRTFEVFMKHMIGDAARREMYLLVGNHDMYHKERWDINSIKPFSAIPGVHIVQTPTSITLSGLQIDWLPHTENPIKELGKLKKDSGKVGDLLLAHIAVHGAITNTFYGVKSDVLVEYDNDMVIVDPTLFDDWKMTLLGHYHGSQKLNHKVEYVGSPLQLSFGEAFQQKHLILLDLDTLKKEYIVNDFSPKHLIVTPKDIENGAYDMNGQFVRIAVPNMGRTDLLDLQRRVAKECRPLTVDVKQDDSKKSKEEDALVMQDVKNLIGDIESVCAKYVDEKGVPDGLDRVRLLEVMKECLTDQEVN